MNRGILGTMIETLRGWRLLRRLRSNVRRTPEELERMQSQLLRAAITHAYENVPFYRRVWDEAGFDARSFRGLADLGRIPLVTRDRVKEGASSGELLARTVDVRRCTCLDSSGSSGHPLRIWKRPLEERFRRAVGLRIWFELGFRWHHATVQFQSRAGPGHVLQKVGIGRKAWISLDKSYDEQFHEFLATKPDVVVASSTVLRRICEMAEASGVSTPRPRIVLAAGEPVDVETREMTRRVLGTEPINLYAQTEVGYVAWQCERRDAFHINADTHLIEVLRGGKPAAPGELGTIVTTDLRSRTMPILRYDTQDLAVASGGPCPCGRSLPTLSSLEGRASAALLAPDGRVVTTRELVDHVSGTLRVGEYRLFQLTPTGFRLERIEGTGRDDEEAIRHLRELLGKVEISVERLPAWNLHSSGKTHTVFSSIAIPEVGAT